MVGLLHIVVGLLLLLDQVGSLFEGSGWRCVGLLQAESRPAKHIFYNIDMVCLKNKVEIQTYRKNCLKKVALRSRIAPGTVSKMYLTKKYFKNCLKKEKLKTKMTPNSFG